MEIEPQYVDIAVVRWQQFTGKAAIHASEKKTFEEIEAARGSCKKAGPRKAKIPAKA